VVSVDGNTSEPFAAPNVQLVSEKREAAVELKEGAPAPVPVKEPKLTPANDGTGVGSVSPEVTFTESNVYVAATYPSVNVVNVISLP
jgi:hypothetical protein